MFSNDSSFSDVQDVLCENKNIHQSGIIEITLEGVVMCQAYHGIADKVP